MAAELHYLLFDKKYFFTSTYNEIKIITIKNTFCQSLAFLELKKL